MYYYMNTNVFEQSAPANNTFQLIEKSDKTNTSTNEMHTRIYEYLSTSIQLDEMSIPIVDNIDSNATIDASTN